jgi:hypothetical protein
MEANQILENLRKVRESENNAKKLRNGANNEIASINLAMDEGIEEGSDVNKLRELKNERTNKESYRKSLNSEIHKLSAAFDDILYERGDYDAEQITFFDPPVVENEETEDQFEEDIDQD